MKKILLLILVLSTGCMLWAADEPVLTAKYATATPTQTETASAAAATATFTSTHTPQQSAVVTQETAVPEVTPEPIATPTATATKVLLLPSAINIDNTDMYAVKLRWVPVKTDLTYDVFRRDDNQSELIKINAELQKGINEYADKSIKPGNAYYYLLAAYDTEGNTTTSQELYIKTAPVYPPGKPSNFRALQDIEAVSVRWDSSQKGTYDVVAYNIFRSTYPEANEPLVKLTADKKNYEDISAEPGKKYYYRLNAVDEKGNETYADGSPASIAMPPSMTGLILMPSGYRNDIFNNLGLNVDMSFSYFIGSIAGEHNLYPYGKGSDAFEKIGVWLLSGDAKFTALEGKDGWPAIGAGYIFTVLLRDQIGASSEKTGVGVSVSTKKNDSLSPYQGIYISASRDLFWKVKGHAGYIFGDTVSYMNYMTEFLPTKIEISSDKSVPYKYPNSYFLGLSLPVLPRMGFKVEYIVPGSRRNALLPDTYLINTHFDRLLNFDISYFKYPGGYSWIGYFSFRFTIFPNPYKADQK